MTYTDGNMSTETSSTPEVLHPRKRPWLKRLWVRIVLVLTVMFLISLANWWWPRRTMVAVWRVGGTVACKSEAERTRVLLQWWDPSGSGWGWTNFRHVHQVLSWRSVDSEITSTNLQEVQVSDEWLIHLKQFPKLHWLGLNNRQLGPGLDHLQNNEQLIDVSVTAAADQSLMELTRLPQLETVGLWLPARDISLDALTKLPKLKSLYFAECDHADDLLDRLPELPNLDLLVIQDCQGFTDDDLVHLQRLPNLTQLDIVKSIPIGDAGLQQICKLKNLETLAIRRNWGDVSNEALELLKDLPKLKEFIVIKGDLSQEQLDFVKQLLPGVTIMVN